MKHDDKIALAKIRRGYVAHIMAHGEDGRRRARRNARKWTVGALDGNT